jgi:hypothetical protein
MVLMRIREDTWLVVFGYICRGGNPNRRGRECDHTELSVPTKTRLNELCADVLASELLPKGECIEAVDLFGIGSWTTMPFEASSLEFEHRLDVRLGFITLVIAIFVLYRFGPPTSQISETDGATLSIY